MNYIISKIQEWISNLWIKILFIIPTCFFKVDQKDIPEDITAGQLSGIMEIIKE